MVIRITDDCLIYNDMPRGWREGNNSPSWHKNVYYKWRDMWRRCKDPKSKDYENYKDCEIDEKYRYLSNYVNDIMQLDNFDLFCLYPNEYHVDKDKLDPNNRCYFFEHLSIVIKKDNIKERNARRGLPKKKGKPLLAFNHQIVLLFKSYTDAVSKNFDSRSIRYCLLKQRNLHKGYKWYYINYSHSRKYRIKDGEYIVKNNR